MKPLHLKKKNPRQHQILEHLLEHKNGLSVDELAKQLGISRTAVQQHFIALERDELIKKTTLNKTAGRPVTLYGITDKGVNYFRKQYAWFAELILSDLQQEISSERFKDYMRRLAIRLADDLRGSMAGKTLDGRIEVLVGVMNDLGFQVKNEVDSESNQPKLSAYNCIYHDLAQKHQEICEFDLALMSSLLEKQVEQSSCMAKGDCVCRFKVKL